MTSATFMLISLICTLIGTGLSSAQIISSSVISSLVNWKNSTLKSSIQSLVNTVSREINSHRLSLSKILSLLANNNQLALSTYLMNNPAIVRNAKAIQQDSDAIAAIQAEQNAIEQEINSLTNELNQLGYATTTSGADKEQENFTQKRDALNKAKDRYKGLIDKANSIHISTTNPVKPYTGDIDAQSQNINGGLKS